MAPKNWHILIVDGDADYVASLKPFLQSRLGRIFRAESIEQAQKILSGEKIDLILLETILDEADAGLRWCRELKASERFKAIPIFILSAADERFGLDLKSKLDEAGYCPARGFWDKATQPADIVARLEKFLRSQD